MERAHRSEMVPRTIFICGIILEPGSDIYRYPINGIDGMNLRNVSLLIEQKSPGFPGVFRGHVWRVYGALSTWFDSKILYILDEMQYLTWAQRLYPNSATAVDQICRFQRKIRIKVDKIA